MSASTRPIEWSRRDSLWAACFRAMGGPCEVLVDCPERSEAQPLGETVANCAWRIEEKFSRYRADSVVARINASAGAPIEVDDETADLLDFAAHVHLLSDGLFDVTSGVLRRAWDFDGSSRTPAREQIARLMPMVGWAKVRWERPRITLMPGMQIDFGGIGKEYAVDRAIQKITAISRVPVLVNFGGDLAVTAARKDNRAWRVGIDGIGRDVGKAARLVELSAGAIATSGDTYRFIEAQGRRLPHILDPRDGWPVRDAPRSVTVAAPSCTQAGMLTTLAMLRGATAEHFLATEGVRHWVQREASA